MKIYNYGYKGEYIYESEARIDPLETKLQGKDIFLIPASATIVEPPEYIEGKKIIFSNGTWIHEDIIVVEEKVITWEEIRQKRDYLLKQTDWTQLADTPLDEYEKETYEAYRQELRDIPQNFENAEDVIFPIMNYEV